MDFIADLGLFTLKTILIVASILTVLIFIIQMSAGRGKDRAQIEVEKLNIRYRSFRRHLQRHLLAKKQFKNLIKEDKKSSKKEEPKEERLFVIDFHGDIRASATHSLREEITAVISVAKPGDEVVVRLESGGGLVTSYGLAASQLARLKQHGIKLTICVDKIAASGGYMMACVADKILAAPFAVLGSIGVIAQVPNFNRLLKKHDIDYREITAGEFKRTVTVFGEITPPGLEKFKDQIEETHDLFKAFVSAHRPKVEIAKVATGEHWYGTRAVELGLVDELITSDEYLFQHYENEDVFHLSYKGRKGVMEKLSDSISASAYRLLVKLWSDLDQTRLR